jgi:hypothetical protein
MRILVVAIVLVIGCHGGSERAADAGGGTDHLEEIFDEVDGARITQTLRELSGVVPATVNGASIMLGERFDDAGRQRFRDYWTQTMRNPDRRGRRRAERLELQHRPPVLRYAVPCVRRVQL